MKIIKMSVDTFWKGEVRVQGQIEDETKVYQTRIFIKGSQIYDYSCSCAEGNSFRGPCVHAKALQEAFARQQALHQQIRRRAHPRPGRGAGQMPQHGAEKQAHVVRIIQIASPQN